MKIRNNGDQGQFWKYCVLIQRWCVDGCCWQSSSPCIRCFFFFCNFSTVKRFCRFCYCTKDQLADNTKIGKVSLRTEKGYNNNIKSIEQDSKFSSVYVIKKNSCWHQLKYYHVINGLPADLAHDVFDCISFFCKNDTFSLEFLNNQISLFDFTKRDRRNKPQPLKIISSQNFKIKQTVCEMWNLVRLIPLLVGSKVDKGDKTWGLLVCFIQLIEKLCALSFNHNQLIVLISQTEDFFVKYLAFSRCKSKTKQSFS